MKTWFITGTSSGFGRILTERLLLRGDRVAATLRRTEALDAYAKIRSALVERIADLDAQKETALSTETDN